MIARLASRSGVVAFALATLLTGPAYAADSLAVVPPIARPGPYPVACTDIAQDFSRVGLLETANLYWRGAPRDDGTVRYVTDLLSEPAATITYTFTAPSDTELFGQFAGRSITDVALVCYPTTSDNTRADYLLPNGKVVPRMQRANDAPLLAAGGPFPVLVFSHGYAGSPLETAYLGAQITLASFGYVTVAPFHGDLRYSILGFEYFLDNGIPPAELWNNYVGMQALRPTSASRLLDAIAAHPQWSRLVDVTRSTAFGISQGGETLMLMGGAEVTTTPFQHSKFVMKDPRLASAVGYVPYFGLSWLPSFGRDQHGAAGVTLPYLAIGGTADNFAQIERIEQAMRLMEGTRSLVAIDGLQHDLEPQYPDDIFTWAITFLASQARGDVQATAKLQRMTQVAGGATDVRRIDYTAPLPASGNERMVVEYYHAGFNHYFVTADPAEAAGLDTGAGGWARTGLQFKATDASAATDLPNCRFFGIFGAVSTHFYTINASECASLTAQNPPWQFESYAFRAAAPSAENCPADRSRVLRIYNNGQGGATNHRYTTSASEAAATASGGWTIEGAVFCAKP